MGFLRRLLGRADDDGSTGAPEPGGATRSVSGVSSAVSVVASADDEERAHELELARFEQDRTTDLVRRQQRYSDRSWTPPAQGGPKRADDADETG